MGGHPTILLGYGRHGLDVLRRLVVSASLRGVIPFEESRPVGLSPNSQLPDLGLLWIPDRLRGAGRSGAEPVQEQARGKDLMYDAYARIVEVHDDTDQRALQAAVLKQAETLLTANVAAAREAAPSPGLDVILLGQVGSPEDLGALANVMGRTSEVLANSPTLSRQAGFARKLTLIEILDFEHYWDRGGGALRRSMRDHVLDWEQRAREGRPAPSRIWMTDGHSEKDWRSADQRADETALMLELMLFEGLRADPDLNRLFELGGPADRAVGTFGVRRVERSAGLLSKLAAGWFGERWMEYLVGAPAGEGVEARKRLRELLKRRSLEALREAIGAQEVAEVVERACEDLTRRLCERIPAEPEAWLPRYEAEARQGIEVIRAKAEALVASRVRGLEESDLDQARIKLVKAIDGALGDPREPATLGAVLAELDACALASPVVVGSAPESLPSLVKETSRAWSTSLSTQLDPHRLSLLWPLMGIILGVGAAPLLVDLLARFSATHGAVARLVALGTPGWALVLMVVVWAFGALVGHRGVLYRVRRAEAFHADPERGRVAWAIHAELSPGGRLRAPLDRDLNTLLEATVRGMHMDLARQALELRACLNERSREARWLCGALHRFLSLHGLDPARSPDGRLPAWEQRGAFRMRLETADDLSALLEKQPAVVVRFRAMQSRMPLLSGWSERWSSAFLHPLSFLDRLSRDYVDPLVVEQAQSGHGPEAERHAREFVEFLEVYGQLKPGVVFPRGPGVPAQESLAVVPRRWSALPSVRSALVRQGFDTAQMVTGEDQERAWLIRLVVGIAPERLVEGGV